MPAPASPTAPSRAAIYARFSSDLQSDRSIADQLALCRDYAARLGWQVVATYADHAASGASMHGRPQFQQLIADAEAHRFEVMLAEDVDRYARNSADVMRFAERAEFAGVRIFTVADGEANELLFGFKGIMSAQWLKTHALKIRRGLDGVVREGRSAGGRAYGYAPVPGQPGARAIAETEAAIVRRIFAEYLDRRTPREIAHGLNRDGVAAPRGRQWNASTINGARGRQNGILFNPLYAGTLVWNRVRMVKDPATGKRISRLNPADVQRRVAVPQLAIVTPEIFAAVRARKDARAALRPEAQRKPRHILSGLLRCAACGGGLSACGTDKSGRIRVRCSIHQESHTCPAPATFYLDAIERLVLETLRVELREPAMLAAYVREYHAERQRLAAGKSARRDAIASRLSQIARELPRLVDAIAQGVGDPHIVGDRMKALVAERDELAAERERLAEPAPLVALHPHVLARYEVQLADLQAAVARGMPSGDDAGARALRDLVESVTVGRTVAGSLQVRIHGRLEALVGTTLFPSCSASGGTLVAGERSSRSAHWPFQLLARAS